MNKNELGCSIGKSYKYKEPVDGNKLRVGLFSLFNPVLWLKDISSIFNVRKLIIYTLVIAGVLLFGYFKGLDNRPVKFDIGYGKEVMLRLNDGQRLHISEHGRVTLQDSNGNILKTIKVKDIPELQKKLSPFGLNLKPIVVGGIGVGKDGNPEGEVGVGLSLFRVWKFNLEAFATNLGIYGGVSYNITDNFGVGVGVGKSFSKEFDNRMLIYARWRF